MKLRKTLIFIAALCSSVAFAQDVGVTGAELLAGAGDAKLAALGRQAADSGKRVVVSAPDYWHDKVAQKILAGAHGTKIDLVMKDSFVEAVVVRLADKTPEPAATPAAAPVKPAPAVAVAPAAPAKPVVAAAPVIKLAVEPKPAKVETIAAAPKAEPAPTPVPAPTQAPASAATPPAAAVVEAPVAAPAPVAPTPVAAPANAPAAASDQIAVIQKRMEKTLNDGAAADGNLSVANLEVGDQIYVDGPVRAVVRRRGTRQVFWLDGELNLLRTELVQLSKTSYELKFLIDPNTPAALRTVGTTINFTGKVPAEGNAERVSLEKQLNDAHPITAPLEVSALQLNDLIYVGADSAVVVRRSGSSLLRYWLVGSIDLGQSGVARESNGKYRVRSDTLK